MEKNLIAWTIQIKSIEIPINVLWNQEFGLDRRWRDRIQASRTNKERKIISPTWYGFSGGPSSKRGRRRLGDNNESGGGEDQQDDSSTSASAAATSPGAKVHHPIGEKDPVGVRSQPPMTRKAGEKSGSSAKVTAFNRREWRVSKQANGVQFRIPRTLPAMTCRLKGTTVWIAMETPCGVRVCFSFKSKRHVVES